MTELPAELASSSDHLFGEVYDRLKQMAGAHLASGGRSATLDTTVLVHELYLRMQAQPDLTFVHRGQFFTYAARAMRHLLIDLARAHACQRAGGDWAQVTLTANQDGLALDSAEQTIALDAGLTKLAAIDVRAANVVELRYFAGLTWEQAAEVLDISKRTADRDWTFALAFLKAELG